MQEGRPDPCVPTERCRKQLPPESSGGQGSAPQNGGVYCGLSQVPTFLPESFIVMFMPSAVAWIAPV